MGPIRISRRIISSLAAIFSHSHIGLQNGRQFREKILASQIGFRRRRTHGFMLLRAAVREKRGGDLEHRDRRDYMPCKSRSAIRPKQGEMDDLVVRFRNNVRVGPIRLARI